MHNSYFGFCSGQKLTLPAKTAKGHSSHRPSTSKQMKKGLGMVMTSIRSGSKVVKILSSTDEAALVSFIVDISACGYGYSRKEVAELVSETAYFLNRRDCNNEVTDEWLQHFFVRWPDLKVTTRDKADIITEKSVTNYYRELLCILRMQKLLDKSHCIYIIHDTEVASRYNEYNVVESFPGNAPRYPSGACVQAPMAVVVSCMNATGQVLPPYLVFKGKRMMKELLSDGLPETSGTLSDNGLLNSRLLQTYLNDHFLKHVPCSKENPAVILYDGHRPHINVPLIDWAEEQSIILYLLPARPNHTTPSQDAGTFEPFKSRFESQCGEFLTENPGRIVTRYDICKLVAKTYTQVMTREVIVGNFSTLGIVPYNPNMAAELLAAAKRRSATEQMARHLASNEDSAEVKADMRLTDCQLVDGRCAKASRLVDLQSQSSTEAEAGRCRVSPQPQAGRCRVSPQPQAGRCRVNPQPQAGQYEVNPQPQAGRCRVSPQPQAGRCRVSPQPQAGRCRVNPQPQAGQYEVNPQPQAGRCRVSPQPQAGRCRVSPQPQAGRCRVSPQPQAGRCRVSPQPQADRCRVSPQPQAGRCRVSPQPQAGRFRVSPQPQAGRCRVNPQSQAGQYEVNPQPQAGQYEVKPQIPSVQHQVSAQLQTSNQPYQVKSVLVATFC